MSMPAAVTRKLHRAKGSQDGFGAAGLPAATSM